ncbi:MAG: hypothetical protein KDD11_18605 [Acidobacteria bacterium]|nr:hypothetical protein [Acidobacteriota bacterium]
MELREPPKSPETAPPDRFLRALAVIQVVLLVVALVAAFALRGAARTAGDPAHTREVAAKLKAAGALDAAAELFEDYLSTSQEPAEARAKIAYSLGTTYLENGQPEEALRWFYEAETLGAGDLSDEVSKKVVHSLELLGRPHAAQAALDARTRLDDSGSEVRRSDADPVVARVGQDEIRRSDVDRALDQMPPQAAQALSTPEHREELLRQLVADRLLWRKAVKLEYDRDPEVERRSTDLLRQLAINRMVEHEVFDKLQIDAADLETFFKAHQDRYTPQPAKDGETPKPPTLDQVRPQVERDYRRFKVQSAYEEMVQQEMQAADVELFPERMKGEAQANG